jgi:hypothetical protein
MFQFANAQEAFNVRGFIKETQYFGQTLLD